MNLQAYVDARVVEDGDCLRWRGYSYNGHPGGTLAGRKMLIRRELWAQAHGPIPPGKIIRCMCGTPLCVTIAHCELTTYRRIAKADGALGLMSGAVRSARIAATKRAGPQSKISQDEARAIFVSDETLSALAQQYGISTSTASRIKRGQMRREFVGNVWAGLA